MTGRPTAARAPAGRAATTSAEARRTPHPAQGVGLPQCRRQRACDGALVRVGRSVLSRRPHPTARRDRTALSNDPLRFGVPQRRDPLPAGGSLLPLRAVTGAPLPAADIGGAARCPVAG